MSETTRLSRGIDAIELGFVEREATPEFAMKIGIQVHLAGLSLSNTVSVLETLGVKRVRSTVHNWVSLESVPNGRIRDERVNAQRSRDTKQIYSPTMEEIRIRWR
jgi:transposase-like protein